MPKNGKVEFDRAIRVVRLPGGQIPIAMSALETRPGRFSVSALREITIRMYEARKHGGDSTEVFASNRAPIHDTQNEYNDGGNS